MRAVGKKKMCYRGVVWCVCVCVCVCVRERKETGKEKDKADVIICTFGESARRLSRDSLYFPCNIPKSLKLSKIKRRF